jgi:hypothetical protein
LIAEYALEDLERDEGEPDEQFVVLQRDELDDYL